MGEKPKRWRFRFRLRTLLIVFAALSVPLASVGRQWRIVHERQTVANWIEQRNRDVQFTEVPGVGYGGPWPERMRSLFGDQYAAWVYVKPSITEEERNRILCAFPEAKQFMHVERPAP